MADDFRSLASRLVAIYVVFGEIPQLITFLEIVLTMMADPTADVTPMIGPWMAAMIEGAIIPWWIKPLEWLSFNSLFAAGFLFLIVKFDLLGMGEGSA